MQARYLAAFLPALGLAACAQPQQAAPSGATLYATDMKGKAALCTVEPVTLTDGKNVAETMVTGGGGWCGIPVKRDGKPLGAGLLTEAPRNGAVYVHTVGDDTRVDYTPRTAAVTPDKFAVKFIPGDVTMTVTVTGAAK